MTFPEKLASFINENTSNSRELSDSSDKLIEIIVLNGETDEIDKNLVSWTVISVSSS